MSHEKPFAEVRPFVSPHGADLFGLFVGGHLVDQDIGPDRPAGDEMIGPMSEVAARINAAVDGREARLLGEVVELIRRHETDGPIFTAVENLCADVFKLHPDGEYVPGDVAMALAFDLGREQAKTQGAWGPLLDALLDTPGEVSALAMKLMEAIGLLTGGFALKAHELTDDELLAECKRRDLYRYLGVRITNIGPEGHEAMLVRSSSPTPEPRYPPLMFMGNPVRYLGPIEQTGGQPFGGPRESAEPQPKVADSRATEE
jgi:hypothetical protein